MDIISYKLPNFEGPLDLLLFLIQKNKLQIYDIPIAELLEQYTAAIRAMQEQNLEIASEFLEMAARLVQIKSAMLLPKHEEAEVLRQELTGELIEYQLCQEAARRLAWRYIGGDVFVREPEEVELDQTYRRLHDSSELLYAYLSAAGRGQRRMPPPAQAFHGIVQRKIVPVAQRIAYVMHLLYQGRDVKYSELFERAENRSELVATFLAVLELVKSERIRVDGEGAAQVVTMLRGGELPEVEEY